MHHYPVKEDKEEERIDNALIAIEEKINIVAEKSKILSEDEAHFDKLCIEHEENMHFDTILMWAQFVIQAREEKKWAITDAVREAERALRKSE